MLKEIWKPIAGAEGYEVSSLGHVRSLKHKRPLILKTFVPSLSRYEYLFVRLCISGKPVAYAVHRLVAKTFIPNPEGKPCVNHINGIKADNRVENLEWCTPSENVIHAYKTGLKTALRGLTNPAAKLTPEQVEYVRKNPSGLTQVQLAEKFSVSQPVISSIQLGRTWKNNDCSVRRPKFSRIPENIRAEIKSLYIKGSHEFNARSLAKRFGVSHKTILNIASEN